jgi:hypothetical protein
MNMKRGLTLSLAAALAVACVSSAFAQSVTLSLDLFYTDPGNTASKGSWQLRAIGSNEGIAGLNTQVLGGAANAFFTAPAPAFKESFDGGTKPFTTDQDGNAATLDMLFAQIPVAAPGPQDLQYGVGVTGGSSDLLGNVVDTSGTKLNNNVLLAHGNFPANSNLSLAPGLTVANVFTALGTATNPPAVGSIVEAAVVTQVRSNAGPLGKAGDANLDGDVDAFQFPNQGDAQILSSNLGKSGKGILWQSGDFNADFDVDAFQFPNQGDAQILTANLGSDAPAGTARAIYDPSTGSLTFDVGANIGVVGLNTAGKFNGSAAGSIGAAAPVQYDANDLAYFSASGLTAGTWDIGAVLATGLGVSDLNFAFTPLGSDTVVAPVEIISVIPEPAAFTLVVFGAAALLGARRRAA